MPDGALGAGAGVSTAYFVIDQGSLVDGTGAIISDYDPQFNPYPNPILGDAPGHFSWDVDLFNDGLIDAIYNDNIEGGDNTGTLAILTNSITNNPDGIFRADDLATLNIGDDNQPLDPNHVFTNLQPWPDGNTQLIRWRLCCGGGRHHRYQRHGYVLQRSGPDFGAVGDPLPHRCAEWLWRRPRRPVRQRHVDRRTLLTLITPSSEGEGDLVLLNSDTYAYWSNLVEIQGLSQVEPPTFTLEDGTTGSGGGLYIDNGAFNGQGLTIDAAVGGGQAAFISGNGTITAPVEMDGTVYTVAKYHADVDNVYGILAFNGPVTGTGGQYYIDASTDPNNPANIYSSTLEFDRGLTGSDNFVTFHGPNDPGGVGTSLWLTMPFINVAGNTISVEFDATIQNFGGGDDIELFNIHATSLSYDTGTDVLSLLMRRPYHVANLQFDSTTDITPSDTFGLSFFQVAAPASGWATPRSTIRTSTCRLVRASPRRAR